MKSRLFLFALSGLMISCGLSEIDSGDGMKGNSIWGGPVDDENMPELLNAVCYMTAFQYPDGYDWHSDQGEGDVRCSLVVYMNTKPIMKIPVGDEYEVSSSPDMHRIIDGHLYTDYFTDRETVIKRDGVELYRYEALERLCGMAVVEDDIYTLGENRTGRGFSYRRNADVLVSRENGTIIGTLRENAGELCFAFTEEIWTADGYIERYYVSRDGTVTQTALREDVVKVWDILPVGDDDVYVATLKGIANPVLIRGENLIGIYIPSGAEMISCRLLDSQENVCIDGLYVMKDGTLRNGIWINGVSYIVYPDNRYVSSIVMSRHDVFCALNPSSSQENGIIYHGNNPYQIPDDYICVGNDALALINGFLYVGLSSSKGGPPLVWRDGHLDTLKINGYISSMSSRILDK